MKRSKFSTLDTIVVFLLFGTLMVAVVTCTYKNATTETSGLPSYVHRYVDEEAGVVCWVYMDGIDCLPIEQTRLEQ